MKFIMMNGPKPSGLSTARPQALMSGTGMLVFSRIRLNTSTSMANFFVSVLIADVADKREAKQPDSAVAESHLLTDVVSAMDKGTLEVTGESIRMEGRHPLGERAGYTSIVHFVNPKFRLNSVDELMTLVNVHSIV